MKFTVPITKEDQLADLRERSELSKAVGWPRAAIVYSLCEPGKDGPKLDEIIQTRMSFRDLANLGYYGLRHHQAISKHWHNWQSAIDEGLVPAGDPAGMEFDLDAHDYPPTGNGGGDRDAFTRDTPVEEKVEALDSMMEKDPEFAKAVERDFVQKAGKNPALVHRINRTYEEFNPTPTPKEKDAPTDLESLIFTGVGAAIYVGVQQKGEQIQRFQQYLEGQTPDDQLLRVVDENLDTMDKARDLINMYQDALRKSVGRDADATFHRLVTE